METEVNSEVWASHNMIESNTVPACIYLKDASTYSHQRKYPLRPEARKGLKDIIKYLKQQGLRVPARVM
jgi:peptidoglycan/xylan/chitin deacetylase (PgdA/CDA1 family)